MIGAQVIVGRNSEPFLEAALRSVDWLDYVVVLNTAPETERGKDHSSLAHSVVGPDRLRYLNCSLGDHFDFAVARNTALRLVGDDDWVLIVDADDVHFPELENVATEHAASGADMVSMHFHHLMVYKDLQQGEPHREVLFRNGPDVGFIGRVHEKILHPRRFPATETDYRYVHYGYIKPAREVFDRWQLYSELEGDPRHYAGQEPDNILVGRLDVCEPFPGPHPPAAAQILDEYPESPNSVRKRPVPGSDEKLPTNVGLILLTYDDAELLPNCLETLARTRNDFDLLVIDNGSFDRSVDLCYGFKREGTEVKVLERPGLSLTEALNTGLRHFMARPDIEYVGWVHPDMDFCEVTWLEALRHALDTHPELAKVCAANLNVRLPDAPIDGVEQCWLIRLGVLRTVGLFDESFQGIGGREDWDLDRRILAHNRSRVMIWPSARVRHEGMATRSRRDTDDDARANATYYYQKWGTYDPAV